MKDISSANFLKSRIENPPNYDNGGKMDLSRPRILILGGENTVVDRIAYSYIVSIATALYKNNITNGLDIYSAYYKFRDRNSGIDRLKLFRETRGDSMHCHAPLSDIDADIAADPLCSTYPNYVDDVFKFSLMPLLFDKNRTKFSCGKAKANIRNLIIYTHCHGAYIVRMLETCMTDAMQHFYSEKEIYDIQKQLLVINHAPYAPLENCRFSSVSFGSASDTQISFHNCFDYVMKSQPQTFQPAFYGKGFGNIMIADKVKTDPEFEHSHVGLNWSAADEQNLTLNGKVLFSAERNALIRGTKAMLSQEPIPLLPDLVSTDLASYESLVKKGMQIQKKLKLVPAQIEH
jgi:hypothetical protein